MQRSSYGVVCGVKTLGVHCDVLYVSMYACFVHVEVSKPLAQHAGIPPLAPHGSSLESQQWQQSLLIYKGHKTAQLLWRDGGIV